MAISITCKTKVKDEIVAALSHEEAEDGLYLRNFGHRGEDHERPRVRASDTEIYAALLELMRDGKVEMVPGEDEVVFRLAERAGTADS